MSQVLALPTRHAEPLQAIAGFAALLRDHGMVLGISEVQAFVKAAGAMTVAQAARRGAGLEAAWRSIACRDARDWKRWKDLFDSYWYPEQVRGTVKVSGQTRPSRDLRQIVQSLQAQEQGATPPELNQRAAMDTALDVPGQDAANAESQDSGAQRAQGGASRTEALHDRALLLWLPQDLTTLDKLARRIANKLRERPTRRWRDNPRGPRLDLRRTLRASLRTGGIPMSPAWRKRRTEKPKLFILVDVSRSMETHAQLFLRIARAFVQAMNARVFVFHTRLAEVSALLRKDSTAVQEKINAVTAGFGGGTRIATSVQDFHQVHARAQLSRAAQVWILSDGYDADEPQALGEQLKAVRRRGARVTWFHPSAQIPGASCMESARAYIDRFIRLNSLRDLAQATQVLR